MNQIAIYSDSSKRGKRRSPEEEEEYQRRIAEVKAVLGEV